MFPAYVRGNECEDSTPHQPTYFLPLQKDWTNKERLVKAAKGDSKEDEILIMV
jgi:hypothetical protein